MRHSNSKPTSSSSKDKKKKGRISNSANAPVTLSDLKRKETPIDKHELTVRQITIRLVPNDVDSPTIRRNMRVLDNPENILQVLNHRRAIEEALRGNNITTGPNQYGFVRQFLTGESLRVFNEGAIMAGNETNANLTLALNHLVSFNCPREVLSKQTEYLKNHLYKPHNLTMRQFVGYYNNLNTICEQLPPNFNEDQKLDERECIIIIANKAPKPHKKMLIQQGYNPENGSMQDLIDYCERAETNEEVEHGAQFRKAQPDSSDSSDNKPIRSRRKKTFPKNEYRSKSKEQRLEFFCKYHKANDSHNTDDCKVLKGLKKERSRDYDRHSSKKDGKYTKKVKELHLMQDAADKQRRQYKRKLAKLNRDDGTSSEEGELPKLVKKKKRDSSSTSESESDSSHQRDPKQSGNQGTSTPNNMDYDSSSSESESD